MEEAEVPQARSLRERTGRDKNRGRAQVNSSQIIFSPARSVCARRSHVPNRNRHRSNLRSDKETLILVRQRDIRRARLRVSSARRDGLMKPNRELELAPARRRRCLQFAELFLATGVPTRTPLRELQVPMG